jgi:hypothetical protein
LGAVGVASQLGGFAAIGSVPPEVEDVPQSQAMGASTSQLVQAMASFGGGSVAADSLSTGAPGAETSQQPLLTTSQHA